MSSVMAESMYGNREAYDPDNARLVVRPDGTQFLQNAPSTYRRVTLPSVPPPDGRTSRMLGLPRLEPGSYRRPENAIPGEAWPGRSELVHWVELSRDYPRHGLWFTRVVRSPGGAVHEERHVRRWSSGNGW